MERAISKRGQSTVEYLIIFTAIIAVVLFAVTTFVRPSLNAVYNSAGSKMNGSGQLFGNNIGGAGLKDFK